MDEPVRFCEQCGAEAHASAKFCQSCGHEIGPNSEPLREVAGTTEDPPDEASAVQQVQYFCSTCNNQVAEDATYCDSCGDSFESDGKRPWFKRKAVTIPTAIVLAFLLLGVLGAVLSAIEEETETTQTAGSTSPSPPCLADMEAAASISEFSDTASDLDPTFTSCTSVQEWDGAATATGMSQRIDIAAWIPNRCAGNQDLRNTPLCNAYASIVETTTVAPTTTLAQTTTVAPTTTITVIGPLWQVSTEVDPMTDEITYTAVLRSTGPEHILGNGPSLYVICSHVPSSPTLFLVADMPRGLTPDANFDSATGWTTDVLLRFDKEDAQQLVAPVDVAPMWSNFIYFSDDVSRLWADRRWVVKMLGANQLLISGEAHGSDPVDKYDLRGMEQRAAAVLKPCGR